MSNGSDDDIERPGLPHQKSERIGSKDEGPDWKLAAEEDRAEPADTGDPAGAG
ncbi:MAG: hypothetical protein ACFCVK_00830 [Acidimicrobiales bacterium]